MGKGSTGKRGAKAAEALRSAKGASEATPPRRRSQRNDEFREPFTGRPAGRGWSELDSPIDPNDTSPIEIQGDGGRVARIYRAKPTGSGPVGYVVQMVEPDGSVSVHKTDSYAPAEELSLRYVYAQDATGSPEPPRRGAEPEPQRQPHNERPEDYGVGYERTDASGRKVEISPDLDDDGRISSWEVRMFDVNGKRRIERVPGRADADAMARSHLGIAENDPIAAPRRAREPSEGDIAGPMHGPWEWGLTGAKKNQKLPKEGSAARRILERLDQRRWSSVTASGPKKGMSTSGDAPTLEYVRSILADQNNPEAAALIREWLSQKKNSDWTKRFSDDDLRPGETRQDVIREIKESAARWRPPSAEGEPNLAQLPASNVEFREQPPLSRRGNATADEVAEMKRRSGVPHEGLRRPPFTRESHNPTDFALKRTSYEKLPQDLMTKILDPSGTGRGLGKDIDGTIAALVKSGELPKSKVAAAKAQAQDTLRLYRSGRVSTKTFKDEGKLRKGEVSGTGGTAQTQFDRGVNRAVGAAPHERINVAGGDPADFDEMMRDTEATVIRTKDGMLLDPREVDFDRKAGDKLVTAKGIAGLFEGSRRRIKRAMNKGEMSYADYKDALADIDEEERIATENAKYLADQDVTTDRTVGVKEFKNTGYNRGNSMKVRLNALDQLLGESKRFRGIDLTKSYTSPREAALDIVSTIQPEGWEVDGLEKLIADRYRDAKWAAPGTAVRGKGAGPFDPPARRKKGEAAPPAESTAPAAPQQGDLEKLNRQIYTPDRLIASQQDPDPRMLANYESLVRQRDAISGGQGSAPMTNPLPQGGSPVGVAEETTTEIADMGVSGGAARRGKKSAKALSGADAPAPSVPDSPPMTNPLPAGGSPVGLPDGATSGPAKRGRKKVAEPSPEEIFPDEADVEEVVEANPARDKFRRGVSEHLSRPPLPPRPAPPPAGMFPLEPSTAQLDWARSQRAAMEAEEARRRVSDARSASESWDSLAGAAEQAAIANQRPALPQPWELAEARRLQEEAEAAALPQDNPAFWSAMEGADEFDPNAEVIDSSPRPDAPSSAQRKWDEMTGNSQSSSVSVTDEFGPMGDMYGPSPAPPGYTPPQSSADAIRLLMERRRGGAAPSPAAVPSAPPPPSPAPSPAAAVDDGGASRWPSMQGSSQSDQIRAAAGERVASVSPNPQIEEARRWPDMSGGRGAQEAVPAPPSAPSQPPKDSPGWIRRLMGGAGKVGLVGGGLGVGAYMAGGRGGSMPQGMPAGEGNFEGAPTGVGVRYASNPNVLVLTPEEAMILDARMRRGARAQDNGFQTSFNFGR